MRVARMPLGKKGVEFGNGMTAKEIIDAQRVCRRSDNDLEILTTLVTRSEGVVWVAASVYVRNEDSNRQNQDCRPNGNRR
jgi:hypothetical protein